DADAERIESIVRELPHPTTMLRAGESPEQILQRIFGDAHRGLEHRDVSFHCPCSADRAEPATWILAAEAVAAMIEEGAERGGAEVICEFCTERYIVTLETLATILAALHDNP